MKDIRWVVQTNLGSGEDAKRIIEACESINIEVVGVEPIPFDTEVRDVQESDKETIYYGSTNFITNALGVHPNFNVNVYTEKYGEEFLNHNAGVMSFEEHMGYMREGLSYAADPSFRYREIFIRPVEDMKEFAGRVTNIERFMEWGEKVLALGDATVTGETQMIVAQVKELTHEWRLFIIDGKVCTGSFYRANGRGVFIDYMPQEVIDYAEEQCKVWTPSDIFVMDIARCDGEYKIIECNGWNSCGFYKSDISKLVKDVTEFTKEKK